MNKSKKYMYIGLFILLVSTVGSIGTYAYFTWSSTDNTSVTLSIGELADVTFTTGPDIKVDNLSPVYNYTDGVYTTFNITNKDTTSNLLYTVKLNITSIDTELQDKTFKYVLLENDKIVSQDNFESTQSDTILTLYTGELDKGASSKSVTSTYKLYFYIDGNEENNPNMMNKSLVGKIDVSIESNVLMGCTGSQSSTSTFLDSDIKRENISSVSFIDNLNVPEGLKTIDVSKDKNSSILMWYTDEDNDGNYDITIGSEDKIYASSGRYLFSYLISATSLDLTNFDTSIVTDMVSMFKECDLLTSLDLSNFDTSNVTSINSMFSNCFGLENINLSSFKTDNVTDMRSLFFNCQKLKEVDLSSFNTSKITVMGDMFNYCTSLISVDLSSFDTSNVTNMINMFNSCTSLEKIDLSNFDTSNVTIMEHMFSGNKNLKTIYVSDLWDISNVTNSNEMFRGCNLLVGAITYDSSKTDISMANYTNGYLTKK